MSIPQNAVPPGARLPTMPTGGPPQTHYVPQPGTQVQTIPLGQIGGQQMMRAPVVMHSRAPIAGKRVQQMGGMVAARPMKKKKRFGDKMIHPKVRELVPESQAYMDLLAFERKLDITITRKKLDIQEALKRPMKVKRRLRIYVSHTFYPGKEPEKEGEDGSVPQWELRVEGRLMDDPIPKPSDDPTPTSTPAQTPQKNLSIAKRKFSSFFKSLVIELDKDIYGPDNHLVEWHRTPTTSETDGFQVKRPGDRNVKCTILLLLDYQPMKFKLNGHLAKLLGVHTETRPKIIEALWQYVKTHRLQDPTERDHINCDFFLERIFSCKRMRFMEIPQRLQSLLQQPDPIIINHMITVEGSDPKKTACYDIDVEIEDPLKEQMQQFVQTSAQYQDIAGYDQRIYEAVEQVNEMKLRRDFYLSFADNPQDFIQKWLVSQSKDLKTITEMAGQPEEERKADYYFQPWIQEAVCRFFYNKVQQRRSEMDQTMGLMKNS